MPLVTLTVRSDKSRDAVADARQTDRVDCLHAI